MFRYLSAQWDNKLPKLKEKYEKPSDELWLKITVEDQKSSFLGPDPNYKNDTKKRGMAQKTAVVYVPAL